MKTTLPNPPQAIQPFDLMTMDEVAEVTRIGVNTLRWYRHNGTGPKGAKIGGRVMYRRTDVEAWVEDAFNTGEAK